MIDEEHRRTARGVLLAYDLEPDIAQLAAESAEQGGCQIHSAPPVVRQQPDDRARADRRGEAAEQARRPGQRHRMELTSLGPEPHDVPSAPTGVPGQVRPGVDRVREPDRFQKRDILVAIGVRVAVLQRDSFTSREFTDRRRLAFLPRRAPR